MPTSREIPADPTGSRISRIGCQRSAGALTFAIRLRLQGFQKRISRYYERFRAGSLTPPRPRARKAAPRPSRTEPGRWDHLPKLPTGRMWLVQLVPGIGVGASHLRILLDEPEMRAMLEAAPQIGRTLRPLWHMLSRDPLPDILRRPEPPPKESAEPGPRPWAAPSATPPPRMSPDPPAPEVAGPARDPPPLPA